MWRTGLFEVGFIGFESRQSCRLCRSSSKEISVLGWINGGLRRVCATLPHSVSSDFVTTGAWPSRRNEFSEANPGEVAQSEPTAAACVSRTSIKVELRLKL